MAVVPRWDRHFNASERRVATGAPSVDLWAAFRLGKGVIGYRDTGSCNAYWWLAGGGVFFFFWVATHQEKSNITSPSGDSLEA